MDEKSIIKVRQKEIFPLYFCSLICFNGMQGGHIMIYKRNLEESQRLEKQIKTLQTQLNAFRAVAGMQSYFLSI